MNDFASLEKGIVRELSCRLCLCSDVVKLKPLSAEVKRKLKKLFDIQVRADDTLPKAICHECLQQVGNMHLYTVKVDKTQRFLDFYKSKSQDTKREPQEDKKSPLIGNLSPPSEIANSPEKSSSELQQGDTKPTPPPKSPSIASCASPVKQVVKNNKTDTKYMEAMPLEEFAKSEKLDKTIFKKQIAANPSYPDKKKTPVTTAEYPTEILDPVVLIDGRPAKQGQALDKQISLFYKMECCICHESCINFRSLMRHYKDRHGVPGYVSCCDKKFHYFYPKKIIEHMAFHLQPNIFMCNSCHQNFQTSQDLSEHKANGGRSEGKILCPRCSERYPTYHELGGHIVTHREGKMQCDYCGKQLKHQHRKKTINHMENIILCSQCLRTLRGIEKQEKELKEKMKAKSNDSVLKNPKFSAAMGFSGEDDASTD